MLTKTFAVVQKMAADDPLTEHQIRVLSGEAGQKLLSKAEVAEMLGVSIRQLFRLPLRPIRISARATRFRMADVLNFISRSTEIYQ